MNRLIEPEIHNGNQSVGILEISGTIKNHKGEIIAGRVFYQLF